MPETGAKTRFGVALGGGNVARRETLDEIEIAGAQVGEAHGRVRNGLEHDALEVKFFASQ